MQVNWRQDLHGWCLGGYYLQSCPESRPAGISWRLDDRWPERSPAALTPWSPVPAAGPSLHKTEENTGLQHCSIHYRMIRSQEELDRISSCRETTLNICTFKSPFVTQQNCRKARRGLKHWNIQLLHILHNYKIETQIRKIEEKCQVKKTLPWHLPEIK